MTTVTPPAIHFGKTWLGKHSSACDTRGWWKNKILTEDRSQVTCRLCRNSRVFKGTLDVTEGVLGLKMGRASGDFVHGFGSQIPKAEMKHHSGGFTTGPFPFIYAEQESSLAVPPSEVKQLPSRFHSPGVEVVTGEIVITIQSDEIVAAYRERAGELQQEIMETVKRFVNKQSEVPVYEGKLLDRIRQTD